MQRHGGRGRQGQVSHEAEDMPAAVSQRIVADQLRGEWVRSNTAQWAARQNRIFGCAQSLQPLS